MFKSCLPIKDANDDDDDDDCNEDNFNNNSSIITATITPNSSTSVLKFNTKTGQLQIPIYKIISGRDNCTLLKNSYSQNWNLVLSILQKESWRIHCIKHNIQTRTALSFMYPSITRFVVHTTLPNHSFK